MRLRGIANQKSNSPGVRLTIPGSEGAELLAEGACSRLEDRVSRDCPLRDFCPPHIMSKPMILIDPQPRTMDMIFRPDAQRRLAEIADLIVFDKAPMPSEMLEKNLSRRRYNHRSKRFAA